MGNEVEEQIARLAQQWDAAAPPVSAEEARSRPSGIGELDLDSALAPVQASPGREHQSRWIWIAAAASVIGLIVGVTALIREPPNGSISPAPETTVSTTIATEETAVTTSVAEVVEEPVQDVSTVQALVIERLSTLQGFTATATVHTTQTALDGSTVPTSPEVTSVNEVTVMADGSLWIQGDLALWSSYDASTGVSRGAFVGPDGATQYQEVVGWTDNSTPLLIALRINPVMRFDAVQDTVVEEAQSELGPAWRLTASFGFGAPDDPSAFSQQETYTIDKESGLIVEYHLVSTNDGIEDVTDMSLSNLRLNASLPAEFPGSFPDGAVIDQSGNPAGFTLLRPETAAEQFGGQLFLPATGDSAMRIVMSQSEGQSGETQVPVTNLQITVELRTGFTSSTVLIMKNVLQPGATLTDASTIVVDGALCTSDDGVTCRAFDSTSVITDGALAGTPSIVEGAAVSATSGPVQYVIMAANAEAALAIANSFS